MLNRQLDHNGAMDTFHTSQLWKIFSLLWLRMFCLEKESSLEGGTLERASHLPLWSNAANLYVVYVNLYMIKRRNSNLKLHNIDMGGIMSCNRRYGRRYGTPRLPYTAEWMGGNGDVMTEQRSIDIHSNKLGLRPKAKRQLSPYLMCVEIHTLNGGCLKPSPARKIRGNGPPKLSPTRPDEGGGGREMAQTNRTGPAERMGHPGMLG